MDSAPALFATSFLVGFSGAASPGPMTVLTVSETLATGLRAAVFIVAGHAALELLATAGIAAGLSGLAGNPSVTGGIGLAGGGAMVLMAAAMLWDARRGNPLGPADPATVRELGGRGLRQGGLAIAASLSNPYWFVWWGTVGAAFIAGAMPRGPVHLAAFYAGHILADLAWYLLLAASIVWGRRLLTPRVLRAVAALLALMLGAFGVRFFLHGWHLLAG